MNKLRALGFAFFIIGLYLIASVITSLLFGFYLRFFLNADLNTIQQIIMQNAVVVTAVSAAFALVLIWLFFLTTGKSILKTCRFGKITPANFLLAFMMGTGMALFFIGLLSLMELDRFFPEHQALMELLVYDTSFALSLVLIGFLIPLIEEIVYRGVIFNRLRRDFTLTAAILLQAFFFGLVHFNLLQSGYAFLGSIFIGISYVWLGSIWIPIIIHVAWNSTSVFISTFLETLPSPAVYTAMLITGLVMVVICMKYFKRQT